MTNKELDIELLTISALSQNIVERIDAIENNKGLRVYGNTKKRLTMAKNEIDIYLNKTSPDADSHQLEFYKVFNEVSKGINTVVEKLKKKIVIKD